MKRAFFLFSITGLILWFLITTWFDVSVFSGLLGIVFMLINFLVWYVLYQKMTQNSEAMLFWVSLMGVKFLVLGMVIFMLPKVISMDILSFGVGIFIVAISGICASVGLAKSQEANR